MALKDIMPGEVSQTEGSNIVALTFMWNLLKKKEKRKPSLTNTDWWLPEAVGTAK